MNEEKTVCFLGHRKIYATEELKRKLYSEAEKLILFDNITTFLFGSKSQFNDLCHEVVSELKIKYPHIQRIYVRAEFEQIDDNYKAYLLKDYEHTYFSERAIGAGRAVYIKRNQEMIDNSAVCVVYYNESYSPVENNRNFSRPKASSGTKIAYEYAVSKKKRIINLAHLF